MCVCTASAPENDRRRSSIAGRSDAGRRSIELHAAEVVGAAAEELRERAVDERERRVRAVPADELGLVVDDAAVTSLALAQPALARAQGLFARACVR